jgi:DNA polymerase III alpha subunit
VGFFNMNLQECRSEGVKTNVFSDLIAMNALYRPGQLPIFLVL